MFFIIGLWKNLTKNYPVHGVKIAKMIGVTLGCKLIPRAMLVGLGSVSRAPTREAIMPRALSPLGDGERKGGVVLPPQYFWRAHLNFQEKDHLRSAGKHTLDAA